jgi:hypothetical protein
MLIAYRPELENPPREGGFGIITDVGMIQLSPGVNTDVPETKWGIARKNGTVKRLMALGAIEEVKEQATVQEIPTSIDTFIQLPLNEAYRLLEIMHDEDQLRQWKGSEGRVRVRNAINKRLENIKAGKV